MKANQLFRDKNFSLDKERENLVANLEKFTLQTNEEIEAKDRLKKQLL